MKEAMYFLSQKDMPTKWYNILPDLPEPLPAALHPTGKFHSARSAVIPHGTDNGNLPGALYRFPMKCWMSTALTTPPFCTVPTSWRKRWMLIESIINMREPARPVATNTAIAQAYYNNKEGIKRITTETAGSSGYCPFHRLQILRHGMQGLHGQGKLR